MERASRLPPRTYRTRRLAVIDLVRLHALKWRYWTDLNRQTACLQNRCSTIELQYQGQRTTMYSLSLLWQSIRISTNNKPLPPELGDWGGEATGVIRGLITPCVNTERKRNASCRSFVQIRLFHYFFLDAMALQSPHTPLGRYALSRASLQEATALSLNCVGLDFLF